MAEVDCVVNPMRFGLEHADSVVQLGEDWKLLVRGSIVGADEWTVVRCDHCDVAKFSSAEIWVAIARLGIGGLRRG